MAGNNYTFSIFVKADSAQMQSALKQADAELKKFGKTAEAVSSYVNSWATKAQRAALACAGLQAVASTLSGTLKGLTNSFAGFGEQLSSAALRSGISAASLSKLKYAAEQCGTSFETALDAVKTFQEQLGAASLGDTGAQDKLKAAGVDWSEYLPLDEEDQFLKLAQHIASITVPAEQARAAIELFGDAGYQLLPFFQKGEAGIRELCAEAEKLGLAFGGDDAEQAKALSQQLSALTAAASAAGRSIMAALAPALEEVLKYGKAMTGWIAGVIQRHPQITKVLGVTALGIIGVGTAIAGVTAAYTLLTAVTPLGFWTLMAGGAVSLGAAIGLCAETQRDWNAELEKTKKAYDEQAARIDKGWELAKELETLTRKTSLTNEERQKSLALLAQLKKAYPGIQAELDKTTGKLTNMAEVYYQLAEAEHAAQIALVGQVLHLGRERAGELRKRGDILGARKQEAANEKTLKTLQRLNARSPEQLRTEAVVKAYDAEAVNRALDEAAAWNAPAEENVWQKQNRALHAEYARRKAILQVVEDAAAALKKVGRATEEDLKKLEQARQLLNQLEQWYAAERKKIMADWVANFDAKAAKKAEQEAAAVKKIAEQRAAQLETEKQIYALRDKLLGLEKSGSAAELERLRKENRDLLAKLGVDPNSDDPRAVAAGAAEHAFIGNALGDANIALRKDPVEEAQWRLTQAKLQGNHDNVALAEKKLKQVQEKARKDSIRGLRQEVSEAELRAKETRQAWEEGRLRADLSPEEKLKLGDAAVAADRDLKQKRARLTTLADARYQAPELRQPKDLVTSARGTFSAFGIDAALGADVPKQTLDYIKKLSGIIAAWYDFVQREGKLPTSVQLL